MTTATHEDGVSVAHETASLKLAENKEQPSSVVVPIGVDDVSPTNGAAKEAPELQNGTASEVPKPKSRLSLLDRFIDEPRQLRVVVIGGGLSGITAGILLPAKVPNIKLTIYEKNQDLSGTWLENVYPGVRCDIPSHVYQSTFSPKLDWTDEFAPGAEIRDYWQAQARKYDVYQYAKLGQKVEEASWDEAKSVWRLSVRNVATGETYADEADFLLTATGRFNSWKLPDYPGISEYKGHLRHASHWDPSFDPTGKRVAVIGNGASGIQLVANLQPVVAHLDNYARNRTWIAASWAGDERTLEPQPYSEEQKKSFEDPQTYLQFRKGLENKYWRLFGTFFKDHPDNEALRTHFTNIMRRRLAKKPELLDDIVPDFSPNCRRLTPGPGYLEAITEPNVDYIRTPIERFTETGIRTVDGQDRAVDAVFCATGAGVGIVPPFPIRGAGGLDLADAWSPGGKYGDVHTYFGLATPGFPNLLFVQGPHGSGLSGTVPHNLEVQLTYVAKLLRKAGREGIRRVQPSERATADFVEYANAFFAKTVLTDDCRSWYNGGRPGGFIHGVWPGSAGHVTAVRHEPRWEDWEYEYLSDSGNRFHWYFGNGWTRKEADPESDMTSYLRVPEEVDLRDVHESWWSLP